MLISRMPVEVWVQGAWRPGTLHTCDCTPDGARSGGIVSWGGPVAVTTARFSAEEVRSVSGVPGCPAADGIGS